MPYSGLWCRVALVKTDVMEECITSIIRVTRISELETSGVASNRSTLLLLLLTLLLVLILVTLMVEMRFSETSFLQKPHGVSYQKTGLIKHLYLYIGSPSYFRSLARHHSVNVTYWSTMRNKHKAAMSSTQARSTLSVTQTQRSWHFTAASPVWHNFNVTISTAKKISRGMK
jgi:hypothetical protein